MHEIVRKNFYFIIFQTMEGQWNGPDITSETKINAVSLRTGERNYPGTEGTVYDKNSFAQFADDDAVPAQLRVVGGTVKNGVFSEVVFAPERRRNISGREAGKEIQKIPKIDLTVDIAKKIINGTLEVKEGYEAFKERIRQEINDTGEARVPQTKFSQILIRDLNQELQQESSGRHNISYTIGTTSNGIPIYVIKDCQRESSDIIVQSTVMSPMRAIMEETQRTRDVFRENLKTVLPKPRIFRDKQSKKRESSSGEA